MTSPDFRLVDAELNELLEQVVTRTESELARAMPHAAPRLQAWMRQLAASNAPADYFRQPIGFPLVQLPWWVAQSLGVSNQDFLGDVIYSTLNGYYYIRLVDNVMDGHGVNDVRLLPAASFFHTQFQWAYQAHFAAHHPFWATFQQAWLTAAEITLQDAELQTITAEQFQAISSQKVSAIHIPLAAVCWQAAQPEQLAQWLALVTKLSGWHQFWNDVFDWNKDLRFGTATYFLSEATRRKTADESIAAWVAREGFAWGMTVLQTWMQELKALAGPLNSPPTLAYLEFREELLAAQAPQLQADLAQLARLEAVFSV